MKERPILFSGPMVKAILSGAKTQTRRIVKPQPERVDGTTTGWHWDRRGNGKGVLFHEPYSTLALDYCPYGEVGDVLWVRETWRLILSGTKQGEADYRADDPTAEGEGFITWKPSIFMPRKFSRLTLEITGVKVERLQDITEEDASAEGMGSVSCHDMGFVGGFHAFRKQYGDMTRRTIFRVLWDHINGEGAWDANPWVWCIAFRRGT